MTDHIDIDTAAEREKLARLQGHTPGPWWTSGKYSGREMGCSIIAANPSAGPAPGNPTRGQVAFATAILNTDARRCEGNARLIAAAPDLLALSHRLLDEVDARRAKADKLFGRVVDEVAKNLTRAEKAEAERDAWIETARHHSKAEAAFLAWLRSAGEHMRAFGVTLCDDGSDAGEVLAAKVPECAKAMADRITALEAERDQALARLAAAYEAAACVTVDIGPQYDGRSVHYHIPENVKKAIRALTPADAEAALQRVVDVAWNEAVDEAAEIVGGTAKYHMSDPDDIEAVRLTATEIRALKRPEASHE